jgi:hypothetical protein
MHSELQLNTERNLGKVSEVPLGIKASATWTSTENSYLLSRSKDLPSDFPDLQLTHSEPASKGSHKKDAANDPLERGPADYEDSTDGLQKFIREDHHSKPEKSDGANHHTEWSKKTFHATAEDWEALSKKLEHASKKYATHKQ